ncbi:hypothetical protein EVAR_76764_1 [Eumeta japonica]|uniref:Uncharacterized protein n=1 Tax=Eumeta variegata TaxID=151549 RepID=A0A4C1SVS0_EUMVA|nr:hypothetical protein EVAR_76764_1 [Eumeta japonica]
MLLTLNDSNFSFSLLMKSTTRTRNQGQGRARRRRNARTPARVGEAGCETSVTISRLQRRPCSDVFIVALLNSAPVARRLVPYEALNRNEPMIV